MSNKAQSGCTHGDGREEGRVCGNPKQTAASLVLCPNNDDDIRGTSLLLLLLWCTKPKTIVVVHPKTNETPVETKKSRYDKRHRSLRTAGKRAARGLARRTLSPKNGLNTGQGALSVRTK